MSKKEKKREINAGRYLIWMQVHCPKCDYHLLIEHIVHVTHDLVADSGKTTAVRCCKCAAQFPVEIIDFDYVSMEGLYQNWWGAK